MNHYVYLHKDPVTKQIFYVGKGMGDRGYSTQGRNKDWNCKRSEILEKHGIDREVEVVFVHSDESKVFEVEAMEIYKATLMGHQLTNIMRPEPGTQPMENFSQSIGGIVKYHRKKLGQSQKQFADRCGVGLRFIRELEQGHKTTMRFDKINIVLAMFGLTLGVVKIPK